MEFYLIKDKRVEMRPEANGRKMVSTTNSEIQLEPVVKPVNGSVNSYCELLATSLMKYARPVKCSKSVKSDEICQYLMLSLNPPRPGEGNKGSILVFSGGDVDYSGVSGANIFERLKMVHGDNKFKVNVKLVGFHYAGASNNKLDIVKKDLDMRLFKANGGRMCYAYHYDKVEFPANMRGPWEGGLTFSGDLTVSLSLNDDLVNSLYLEKVCKSNFSKNHKLALEEAVCSDFVIVASNGTEVKCHKSYLAASSRVFRAMFESQMKETITNSIDMPDMSESGVRAFLAFIYYWDLKAASEDCDIAYELFCASEKYTIIDLENAIRELICAKSNEWLNVDMTVRLLLFTYNLKDDDQLFEVLFNKSLKVLKCFNESSRMNLLNSPEYQQLFRTNPKVAMEISTYFLDEILD